MGKKKSHFWISSRKFTSLKKKVKDKQTYLQSWYKTFISLTRTLGSLICKSDPSTESTDQCWGNFRTKPLAGSQDISESTSILPLILSVALGKSVLLFVQNTDYDI